MREKQRLTNNRQFDTSVQEIFNTSTMLRNNASKNSTSKHDFKYLPRAPIVTRRKTSQTIRKQHKTPHVSSNGENKINNLQKTQTKQKSFAKIKTIPQLDDVLQMDTLKIPSKVLINTGTNTDSNLSISHEESPKKLCRDSDCVMYGMNKNCGVLIHLYDFSTNAFLGRSFATLDKGFLRMTVGVNPSTTKGPTMKTPPMFANTSDLPIPTNLPHPPSLQLLNKSKQPIKPPMHKSQSSKIINHQIHNANKHPRSNLNNTEESLLVKRKTSYIKRKYSPSNGITNNAVNSKIIAEDIYSKKYPVKKKRKISSSTELMEEHAYANSVVTKRVEADVSQVLSNIPFEDSTLCSINQLVETVEFCDDMKDHVLSRVFDFGSDDINTERVNIKREVWGEHISDNVFDDLNMPHDNFLDGCGIQIKREPTDQSINDENVELEDFSMDLIPKQEQFEDIFGK